MPPPFEAVSDPLWLFNLLTRELFCPSTLRFIVDEVELSLSLLAFVAMAARGLPSALCMAEGEDGDIEGVSTLPLRLLESYT